MREEPKVLLIGGAGRTGTNVLKDLFSMHSEAITLPFESRFTVDPDGVVHTLKNLEAVWSPFLAEICLERHVDFLGRVSSRSLSDKASILVEPVLERIGLTGDSNPYKEWELSKYFPYFIDHVEVLKADLEFVKYKGNWPGKKKGWKRKTIAVAHSDTERKAAHALGKFLKNVYNDMLNVNKKMFFVDDNTFNSIYADVLLDLLPNAKLVNVVRDPRDTVSSYLSQRWTPSDIRQAALYHREVVRAWWSTRENIDSNRYMEVRLEDFSAEPGVWLCELCKFVNVSFDQNMLRVKTDRANSGRWLSDIPQDWREWVDDIVFDILEEYHYD